MALRFYVVETHPNAERAAARRLWRQKFYPYCPFRTLRTPQRRGTSLVRKLPLFPGYILLLLDIQDGEQWKRVGNTRGVVRMMPTSANPLPCPTKEIIDLREREVAGHFMWPCSDAMPPGTKLRVREGSPLADKVLSCLVADDDKGIVRALFECFGRACEVTLPLEAVRIEPTGSGAGI